MGGSRTSSSKGEASGSVSSYKVFMEFVSLNSDCDASGILSAACYNKWVETRKTALKQPEESFRRVLTAHVCGLIGRKPFPADVEANLLRCLRRKQVWSCFENNQSISIGIKGFRKTGFHESRRGIFGSNATSSTLSPTVSEPLKPYSYQNGYGAGYATGYSSSSSPVRCTSPNSECGSSAPSEPSYESQYEGHGHKRSFVQEEPVSVDVTDPAELDPLHIFNFEANRDCSKRYKVEPDMFMDARDFSLAGSLGTAVQVQPCSGYNGFVGYDKMTSGYVNGNNFNKHSLANINWYIPPLSSYTEMSAPHQTSASNAENAALGLNTFNNLPAAWPLS